MRIFNYGSSHASGYGIEKGYAGILADSLNGELLDYSSPGRVLEHTLTDLFTTVEEITPDDIVLVQLRAMRNTDVFYENTTGKYKLLNLYSIQQISSISDANYRRALEEYKVFLATDDHYSYKHAHALNGIINTVRGIGAKCFMYWDEPVELNKADNPVVRKLQHAYSSKYIFPVTMREYAINNYVSPYVDNDDRNHYNTEVHAGWANIIKDNLV
jgi:hypothetical protein